jgi:hypothetical protein
VIKVVSVESHVIATDYDFESVRALEISCEKCSAKIPDSTLERLQDEAEFPWICERCGKVSKLSPSELDRFADSLAWTIPELKMVHAQH